MSVLGDVSNFITRKAGELNQGVRSGLNKKTIGEIAGIQSIRNAPKRLRERWDDIQEVAAQKVDMNDPKAVAQASEDVKLAMMDNGLETADDMLGYFGARDYADKGLAKRFGVGTARTLGTATAVGLGTNMAIGVADFFNPFGFGSIDD